MDLSFSFEFPSGSTWMPWVFFLAFLEGCLQEVQLWGLVKTGVGCKVESMRWSVLGFSRGTEPKEWMYTYTYTHKGFIRMAYRLWSNESNGGCLPVEIPSIQWFMRLNIQLFFNKCQNPEEGGSNASEERTCQWEEEQMGKEQAFFVHVLHVGHQKVWPRIKVALPASKNSD